jgi:hypothetical protein
VDEGDEDRTVEAVDSTAMDSKAADTAGTTPVGSTVADSVGAAETTNEAAETATANSTCGARHRHANQLLSAVGGRTRGRLPWADIAQASGRGRECTCKFPPHGRAGHVRCRKRSLQRDRSACR